MPVSLSGSILITGSMTTSGTITAQTLVVQTITSSIVNMTGSNIFGSQLTDRQTFTGSMYVTGSIVQSGVNTTSSFSGNVGIGTTTPVWMLELNKDTTSASTGLYPAISINNPNAAGYTGIYLYQGATQKGYFEYSNANGTFNMNSPSSINYQIATVTKMTVNSAGNVGIGLTNPSALLHISGSGSGSLMQISSHVSSSIFYVSGSGNIGIGTIAPRIALEVVGTDGVSSSTSTPNGSIMVSNPIANNSQVMTLGVVNGASNHSWIQSRNSTLALFYSLVLNPSGGNVGIGNSSPSALLHISGSGSGSLMQISSHVSSSIFYVSGSGNVGIGTTSPLHKLHITQAVDGAYPTLGTGKGALFIAGDTNLYGLYIGVNTTIGNSYMQAMRNNTATAYDLILQPVGGNVGIGTSSPSDKLDVQGAGGVGIRISNSANPGYYANLVLNLNDVSTMQLTCLGTTILQSGNTGNTVLASRTNKDIIISPNGSGNVGIGTTSPTEKLTVYGAVIRLEGAAGVTPFAIANNGTDGLRFYDYNAAATRMSITGSTGYVGIGTTSPAYTLSVKSGWIHNYGAQNASGFRYENDVSGHVLNMNANNSYAQLYTGTTTALYFGSNNILSLGINTSGHVIAITDNTYTMGASGNRWSAIWSANGTIQTSDEREKKDITNTDLGLDFISNLRPVCYKWKVGQNIVTREPDGLDENGNEQFKIVKTPREGTRVHYGLIAQEVKQVLGDKDFGGYIHDEDTDIKGLRYDQFIAPLIKAIQELKAEIEELKNK